MSEFIELHDVMSTYHPKCSSRFFQKSQVTSIGQPVNPGTSCFITTTTEEGMIYCRETPEEIMALLEGTPVAEESSPFYHGEPYPEFTDPYEETIRYWQRRSQYWKLRAFRREDQLSEAIRGAIVP